MLVVLARARWGQQLGHSHEWSFICHFHGLKVKTELFFLANTGADAPGRLGLGLLNFARALSFQLKKFSKGR